MITETVDSKQYFACTLGYSVYISIKLCLKIKKLKKKKKVVFKHINFASNSL